MSAYPTFLLGAVCTLSILGCNGLEPPVLRSAAPPPPASANSGDPVADECRQIREQIRANRESEREAPTTSTSPEIVAAAEGKADKRIEDLRTRYDELDCPSEPDEPATSPRIAPLPPAPAAPN
jgi:hypothetical protein